MKINKAQMIAAAMVTKTFYGIEVKLCD